VLYAFLGQSARLTADDIDRLLGTIFEADARRKIVDVLLWYGVLGVVRPSGEVAFIYSVNYDIKRLIGIIDSVPSEKRSFFINPALWSGLEITSQGRLL
jgi:hypothetical protein